MTAAPSPCQIPMPMTRTWAEVEKVGRVVPPMGGRNWHVEFRVRWPGSSQIRRVRITRAPGYGKIESEIEAEKVLNQIRAELLHVPLEKLVSRYVDVPESRVLFRWNQHFLEEMQRRFDRGRVSEKRVRELKYYEGRGYLEFWRDAPLYSVDDPALERWKVWLEERFRKLSGRSIKHVIADFGTFLRWEKRQGTIVRVPDLPVVQIMQRQKHVPNEVDLAKILDAIPEEERGIFEARSFAGLRMSEARRLVVADYDFERGWLNIPPEKSKTRKGRPLDIRTVIPELDAWITRYRKTADRWEPLFVNPRSEDGNWRPRAERLAWIKALKLCSLEHVRPNEGGRHAFVTNEIARGTDAEAVRDWVGHSSRDMIDAYKHVTPVSLARRMRGPKRD